MNLEYDKAKVARATLGYWENVLKLLDYSGKYHGKIALRNNLRDANISWKVQPIFKKYHHGSFKDLDNAIINLEKAFNKVVDKINAECDWQGIVRISEPATLLKLLGDEKRRKFYSREAKKYLAQNKIVPLQKLEKDFERKGQAK